VVSPSDGSRIRVRVRPGMGSDGQRRHLARISAQADVRERAGLRRRLDDFSRKELPAVAWSCLRSFKVMSSFARGAERESLEAVRVADVGAAEGGD